MVQEVNGEDGDHTPMKNDKQVEGGGFKLDKDSEVDADADAAGQEYQ